MRVNLTWFCAILPSFDFLCAPSAISRSLRLGGEPILKYIRRRGAEDAEKIEKTQDSWEVI